MPGTNFQYTHTLDDLAVFGSFSALFCLKWNINGIHTIANWIFCYCLEMGKCMRHASSWHSAHCANERDGAKENHRKQEVVKNVIIKIERIVGQCISWMCIMTFASLHATVNQLKNYKPNYCHCVHRRFGESWFFLHVNEGNGILLCFAGTSAVVSTLYAYPRNVFITLWERNGCSAIAYRIRDSCTDTQKQRGTN